MKQQVPRIAIDVSNIDFMESHALGILVSHFLAMQRQGREMVLINTNSDPSQRDHADHQPRETSLNRSCNAADNTV
ncbi:MAG: STAS domain-containing protein [Fibrobacter sp.]|nr:STAS domain-containing protein [Fibrobacter sp.]